MTVSLETIQEYEIEILKYIDSVCKKQGIQYYLTYGTLLGAVRHQGFIPWDDDIDLSMTRSEFERFLAVMEADPDERYKLCCLQNEPKWTAPLPKVIDTFTVLRQSGHRERMDLGVYVDIFIWDIEPESAIKKWIWHKRLDFLNRLWGGCEHEKRTEKGSKTARTRIKNMLSACLLLFTDARRISQTIDRVAGRFNSSSNSNILSNAIFRAYTWQQMSTTKEIVGNGCQLPFGNQFYSGPEHYDEFLKNIFGDYMQLPPEDERTPHHSYELEIKENDDRINSQK